MVGFTLRPGYCPFCGFSLDPLDMTDEIMVRFELSDKSIMPQPACAADRQKLLNTQLMNRLFAAIQQRWIDEIKASKESERSAQEKIYEIQRISQLYIVGVEVPYEESISTL